MTTAWRGLGFGQGPHPCSNLAWRTPGCSSPRFPPPLAKTSPRTRALSCMNLTLVWDSSQPRGVPTSPVARTQMCHREPVTKALSRIGVCRWAVNPFPGGMRHNFVSPRLVPSSQALTPGQIPQPHPAADPGPAGTATAGHAVQPRGTRSRQPTAWAPHPLPAKKGKSAFRSFHLFAL